MEAIIETGKYKGKKLSECPPSYIVWASKHEKNFLDSHKGVSRDAKARLAPVVVEAVVEPAPVAVERKKIFDRHLCCEVWSDTGERCVPQIYMEGIGWVTPAGTEEVLDVEAGLSWSYAVRRSSSKSRMRAEINAIKNNKRKAFSIPR